MQVAEMSGLCWQNLFNSVLDSFIPVLADFNKGHVGDWWELSQIPSSKYIQTF